MSEQVEHARSADHPRHGMVALEGEGEARRNRLLRRIDWRFLAGLPQPARSLARSGSLLSEALELVSDQILDFDGAVENSADLVALVNPNQNELENAWQVLKPGGALYVEWHRPLPGGPARHRRQLERLGFAAAGAYWPWPWPERAAPAFWLPLEAPGALRYFLSSRPEPHSRAARALRRSLHLAWQIGQRSGLLFPVCIVAHKPQEPGAAFPPTSLAARAAAWGLREDGKDLDWLLLTGGLHSTNKVTALLFVPGAEEPAYVVKMPRRALSLPSLEREGAILQAIQSGREQPLPGVPELVFLNASTEDNFPAIGETHLAGVPLYTHLRSETLESLAHQATGWLLHLVDPGLPQPPSSWWPRLVQPVLDDFARGYASAGGAPLLAAARRELERLGSLPLAVEHRDFSPWNVFLTPQGDLSILDWEGAEPRGLPFADLHYFLTYLAFFFEGALEPGADPGAPLETYRRLRDSGTRLGRLAQACIQDYCSGTGLPAAALRPLRLLTWLRHANLERTLIENSSTAEPDPHILGRGLYLALLKAELEYAEHG